MCLGMACLIYIVGVPGVSSMPCLPVWSVTIATLFILNFELVFSPELLVDDCPYHVHTVIIYTLFNSQL
jgi:hypothetical protein